ELGSFPESDAGIERDIPGLACLIRSEAVLAVIGRAKRKRILAEEGRLPVHRKPIEVERTRSVADQLDEPCIVADMVVEAELDSVHGEGGGEGLRRSRKRHVAATEAAVQIFERRAPLASDRDLDARAHSPAQSPERCVVDRRATPKLATRQLI